MTTTGDRRQTIALAGVFQAVRLVQQVARTGSSDAEAVHASLYSLYQIDAESVEAVFGGLAGVQVGLRTLVAQLSGENGRDMELTRYAIALLQLERKLARSPKRLQRIADGLKEAQRRRAHFDIHHPNMLAQMAEIYTDTISSLQPRIMVQGDPQHLGNPDNVNKIRSLLLAGIRAARLWRQVGGTRWRILAGRKRLLQTGHALLQEIAALPV